jgi:hypothetical protein
MSFPGVRGDGLFIGFAVEKQVNIYSQSLHETYD